MEESLLLSKSAEIQPISRGKKKTRLSVSSGIINSRSCSEGIDIEDTISVCACQQSSSFPICDGTHQTFNRETKSNIQPFVIKIRTSPQCVHSQTQTEDSISSFGIEDVENQHNNNNQSISKMNLNSSSVIQTEDEKSNNQSTQTESIIRPKRQIVEVNRKSIHEEWSVEEVALHNTEDDCWIIVNNCVYDITAYFSFHPGGKRALIKFAGRDATENVQFHSSKMLMLLNKYFYVGRVSGTSRQWSSCSIS
eukprot:TRINITY_DN2486_c0_g1_i2.p1 TRINITY_DN2486_c0_g1~~TRINITY_DN2486_c0_g1_i2.p1  ORF type:complete len:251 (+),score=57.31 TRINITY_DN2486_c0_g1_i2:143-895(+)